MIKAVQTVCGKLIYVIRDKQVMKRGAGFG